MNCPYCGTRNRARAEFCRHCRALLPRPAEPSRWSIVAHARGPGAFALLFVAVGAAFLLGRQVATMVGAPSAVAQCIPDNATIAQCIPDGPAVTERIADTAAVAQRILNDPAVTQCIADTAAIAQRIADRDVHASAEPSGGGRG